MRSEVELFTASDARRISDALRVRFAVFVDEQRVPADEEIDEHDRAGGDAVHALIYDAAQRPVATGRCFVRSDEAVQIGRMAVLAEARGLGLGAQILQALIAQARRRGCIVAVLHAQIHARGFYERVGFVAYGPPFDDAGIPHIAMRRTL